MLEKNRILFFKIIFLHDDKIFFDQIFLNLISWSRRIILKRFRDDSDNSEVPNYSFPKKTLHDTTIKKNNSYTDGIKCLRCCAYFFYRSERLLIWKHFLELVNQYSQISLFESNIFFWGWEHRQAFQISDFSRKFRWFLVEKDRFSCFLMSFEALQAF